MNAAVFEQTLKAFIGKLGELVERVRVGGQYAHMWVYSLVFRDSYKALSVRLAEWQKGLCSLAGEPEPLQRV